MPFFGSVPILAVLWVRALSRRSLGRCPISPFFGSVPYLAVLWVGSLSRRSLGRCPFAVPWVGALSRIQTASEHCAPLCLLCLFCLAPLCLLLPHATVVCVVGFVAHDASRRTRRFASRCTRRFALRLVVFVFRVACARARCVRAACALRARRALTLMLNPSVSVHANEGNRLV